jgi:hypothetical protein
MSAQTSSEPEKKPRRQPSSSARDLPVNYRTIFWVNFVMTAVTFSASFYLATRPAAQQSEGMKNFIASCDTVWKMGVGGFFGLLFGKGSTH